MEKLKAKNEEEARKLFNKLQVGDVIRWTFSDGTPCYEVEIIKIQENKYHYRELKQHGKKTNREKTNYHRFENFRAWSTGVTDFKLYKVPQYTIETIIQDHYEI